MNRKNNIDGAMQYTDGLGLVHIVKDEGVEKTTLR